MKPSPIRHQINLQILSKRSASQGWITKSASLVSGSINSIAGVSGALAGDSAAIGYFNQVVAPRGWAIGDTTLVSADGGVAIGTGVQASNVKSTAIGRYNGPMAANDVLVVGTGSDNSNRSTALRVTNNGDVILGKAQGDIAMGEYGN